MKFIHEKVETMEESSDNAHPQGMAILGPSHGPARECFTRCISCSRAVVLLMPDTPAPDKLAHLVNKHTCDHCRKGLFALRSGDGRCFLCTDCRMISGKLQLTHQVELEVLDDAHFSGGGALRLRPESLVVGKDRNGELALLSPDDLGIG